MRSSVACCINEPVLFSHCVHLKLGHRFHALLNVRSDRDDNVPLIVLYLYLFILLHFTLAIRLHQLNIKPTPNKLQIHKINLK